MPLQDPGTRRYACHLLFEHIIGDEVFNFVSNILHGISSLSDVNCTNIAFIPKVQFPVVVSLLLYLTFGL